MYKVIDLFSGAGGLSYGFHQNVSFRIVAAVENNKYAQKTYEANHKKDFEMLSNIEDVNYKALIKKFGNIDIVIGGPPCQGFSNANRQKTGIVSSNNNLVKEYFKAIKQLKPKVFVMENVKMLSSEKHRFYKAKGDKGEVDSFGIELRNERIVISEHNIFRFDVFLIAEKQTYREYIVDEKLFKSLNTLCNKRRDIEKIERFLIKNSKMLIKLMGEEKIGYFQPEFEIFKRAIEGKTYSTYFFETLEQFILFEKSMKILEEIEINRLVRKYGEDRNTVYAEVSSYSVIEYIDKILGEEYVQTKKVINAIDYGVPQKRQRFILVGARKDLPNTNISGFFEYELEKIFTVRDAIEDLEKLPISTSNIPEETILSSEYNCMQNEYRRDICDSEIIYNHVATKTTDVALQRFKLLGEGQNFHDLSNDMKSTYTTPERTQNTIYLRIVYDKPAGTVVNVRKSMWIHPKKDRAISIREAARLQSFPDSFIFKGTKDSQYQQIGNAVPPKISQILADEIQKMLSK
ncbi:DNA cytosine methyltransferase [Enterococcus sp. AZ072]|uniref:DNA cytosine methyltransferase n=1 Tax=unclassified Enterococcus TaxID=2608891 RepID=UPI003D2E4672